MRFSIGLKIFGIAVLLAVVMMVAAVLSEIRVREAAVRVTALAEHLIPLAAKADELKTIVLREEIHFRRAISSIAAGDAAGMAKARADFQAHSNDFAAKAGEMRDLATAAATELPNADPQFILADVKAKLELLIAAHANLQRLARRIFVRHAAGESGAEAELLALFDAENDVFEEADEALTKEIEQLVESVAKGAEADEELALAFEHVVTAIAVVLGLLLAGIMARALVRPLKRLRSASIAVEAGDLNQTLPVSGKDELSDLTGAFNAMVAQLRQKEKTEAIFGRYVDPRVVQKLIDTTGEDADDIAAGGKQEATVLFSDVAGYSGISERLTPVALVRLMNEYFNLASEPIAASGGLLDKFIGDAVMAFWCPPFAPAAEIAGLACSTALLEIAMVAEFRKKIPDLTGLRTGAPDIKVRIGLATGEVVVGSVGSNRKRNFTVIGDTVNLSSRLEGANKFYGTDILICGRTRELAGPRFAVRELDRLAVAGKAEAVTVFELIGEGPPPVAAANAYDAFAKGLACYRRAEWDEAAGHFAACLEAKPDDPPAKAFLARIERFKAEPPGKDWNGVWHSTAK